MLDNLERGTLKEAMIGNELRRIRSTYSFQLGILITESFFRKPWKILFFPFSFLLMNYNYLKNKKIKNKKFMLATPEGFNPSSVLLFVASEGGKAACERAQNIAEQWLENYNNHLIVVSSNKGLTGLNRNNLSLYMIPDPKRTGDISISKWNDLCENVLFRAILTHLPSTVVFDGPYPYRGVLNAIESAKGIQSIWIQSERTDIAVIEKVKTTFSKMARMDYNELNEWSKINNKRTYHALTNKILIATGYGQHEDLQKPPTLILKTLSGYENLHLISIKGLMTEQNIAFFQELWGNVIENPALSNLQGAIVSDNIELIAKLHSMMVPTLCIMNSKTTDTTKKYIYSLASSGALLVTDDENPDEIILYMNIILNREWNLSITQRNSINMDENWFKRLLLISPPEEN